MIIAIGYYVISFLVSLISPFWGLVGFVCSLLLRFQDHFPQITAMKPFTLLLLGMILSCMINYKSLSKANWLQDKLLLFLFAISIIGLLLLAPGTLINEAYLFLCSLSLYYFASRILKTPQQFVILFLCMAASICYIGYIAIEDIAINGDKSIYIDQRSGRWQGLGYYKNSNEFGQLMITTIPFLIAILLVSKNILLKLFTFSMMALMVFIMIKCASRTVIITLALMIIGSFMLRGKGRLFKKMAIGGGIAGLMLVSLSFMPGHIQERMGTVLDANEDASFQGRTRSWGYGLDMLSWYPLTGVGKNQWQEYHGLAPHNSYIQIMAELGIFGIWIFLWLLMRSYSQTLIIFSNQSNSPPEESLNEVFSDTLNNTAANQDYHDSNLALAEKEIENSDGDCEKQQFIDNYSKTITIAILVTFSAWLFYIFLGNQGYSVWTYFYIGLCAAVKNYLPESITEKEVPLFSNENQV